MEVLAAELLTLPRSRRSVAPRSLHRMFFTSPTGPGINALPKYRKDSVVSAEAKIRAALTVCDLCDLIILEGSSGLHPVAYE